MNLHVYLLIGFLSALYPYFAHAASTNCSNVLVHPAIREDIEIMKSHDNKLLKTFYEKNHVMLNQLTLETIDAVKLAKKVLVEDSSEVVDLAKQMEAGQLTTTNRLDAVLYSRLTRALNDNLFYFRSYAGHFGRIPEMSIEAIRKIESGQLGHIFYHWGLAKIKRQFGLFLRPDVATENGTSGLTIRRNIWSSYHDRDSLPWEIAVFHSFTGNPARTVLPPTTANHSKASDEAYSINYVTATYVLNLATGRIRLMTRPMDNYQYVDKMNPQNGTAIVNSDYLLRRWRLEELASK